MGRKERGIIFNEKLRDTIPLEPDIDEEENRRAKLYTPSPRSRLAFERMMLAGEPLDALLWWIEEMRFIWCGAKDESQEYFDFCNSYVLETSLEIRENRVWISGVKPGTIFEAVKTHKDLIMESGFCPWK